MTKKPDYDLSNPGGRPKDWLDKANTPSPLGAREYGLAAALLAAIAVTGYGLFQLALWLLAR